MRALVVGSALVLALAVGCNGLLGIDEAQPIRTGGSGGALGGAAGSDAASGAAGTSGGTGGSSGAAGAAGAAGAPCVDTTSDSKNCGWCGHDCGAFPCKDSECKPEEVTGIAAFTSDMAMDDNFIFVAGGDEAQAFRYDKQATTLDVATTNHEMYPLALYDGTAYFAEYSSYVVYAAKESGQFALTTLFTAGGEVPGLVADASGLYWQEQDTKKIRRSALDGTNPVDLVTGLINVWFIRLDDSDVYLGAVEDGVYRFPKAGPFPVDGTTLAYFYDVLGDGPAALTLDNDAVYLSTGDPTGTFPVTQSQLLRITKSNKQQSHLADATTLILAIAISDGYAYWVEEGNLQNDFIDGAVRRVKIGDPTAEVETYAAATSHPVAIAVDSKYVWWLNSGWTSISGSIMRVDK